MTSLSPSVNGSRSQPWKPWPQEALLLSNIYIHLPYDKVDQRLNEFIDKGWQPEIALKTTDLDRLIIQDCQALQHRLAAADLKSTVHAPFFDLNPASTDADIRSITLKRFQQTYDFAAEIGASRIVFHPGFDPWRYARAPASWLENSLRFWPELLKRVEAQPLLLCLENIFDTQPAPLIDLLQEIDSPHLRHCFDIGHWFLFSKTPIDRWFDILGPYVSHLHLHDNRGRSDDHRPIGKGKIDFTTFFARLRQLPNSPTATLEAHNQKDAERSLASLQTYL